MRILAFVLLFSFSSFSFAQSQKNAKSSPKVTEKKSDDLSSEQLEAKAVMNQVYESFVKIIPYIYSDKLIFEGKDKKKQDELLNNMNELSVAFKNAKHVNFLKIPGFKPSLDTINTHIQETIDSLQAKNLVFAHARLKAMTQLCVSCHSQLSDQVSKNAFGEVLSGIKRDQFESDFQYANYLYLVRRFTESKVAYELGIKRALERTTQVGKNSLADDKIINGEIFTSLRRVLSIYTKIGLNPTEAIKFLKNYQNNPAVSKFTKTDIKKWIESLEKWKKFDINQVKNINTFIDTHLKSLESRQDKVNTGEHDITLLISSGVLSKYLNDHPSDQATPAILYWLAVAERRLSTTYFFSLSDIYLKDCIREYSKSDFAKKCFSEYEDQLTFGYSGSLGTDIPQEEKRELEKLRSLIK